MDLVQIYFNNWIHIQFLPISVHFFCFYLKCFPPGSGSWRENECRSGSGFKALLIGQLRFFFLVDIGYYVHSATCRTFRAKQKHFLSLFFYNFVNVLILFLLITYLTNCSVSVGGLGATFYVSYFNTALIFILILLLVVEVSPPEIYLSTPYEQSQLSI